MEVFAILAAAVLVPIVVSVAGVRIGRRFFPAGVVAKRPKTFFAIVTVIWLGLLLYLLSNVSIYSRKAQNSIQLPSSPSGGPPTASLPPSNSALLWNFPWPPPAPSAEVRIPLRRILARALIATDDFSEVDDFLTHALAKAGHIEASYYRVPRGFAVVTRLESIQSDGMSKPGYLRWDIESPLGRPFSLSSYLESLFTAPPGRYRVIVFVITPERFATTDSPVTRDDAMRWLRQGANALPPDLAHSPIESNTVCTALIYEFWKGTAESQAVLRRPGQISADRHMVGTGLRGFLQ